MRIPVRLLGILVVGGLGAGLLATLPSGPRAFHPRPVAAAASEIPAPAPSIVASRKLALEAPAPPPPPSAGAWPGFQGDETLKEAVADIEDTLDPERRAAALGRSPLSEPAVLTAALSRLQRSAKLDEQDARERALAVHILNVSPHLDADTCRSMLHGLLEQRVRAVDPPERSIYLVDAVSLVKPCLRVDRLATKALVAEMDDPDVQQAAAQVLQLLGALANPS